VAVLLAVAAAFCNALTSVLQRSAARTAPEDSTFSWRLIAYLLRRPVWFLGMLAMVGGFLFQALALYFGQISTVQPILVAELVFIMIILYVWFHSPVGAQEWAGALGIALGLGTFLYVAHPTEGHGRPDTEAWLAAAAATFVVCVVVLAFAQRGSKARRAALYGTAAALIWAFTAALIKTMTNVIHHGGWSQLFLHWPVYAVVVVGVTGLIVVQSAFQAGPLTASQPALIIVDPMASILIGVWLFNDRLASRAEDVVMETIALLVMAVGVFILSRSPIIIGVHDEDAARGSVKQDSRAEARWSDHQTGTAIGPSSCSS
jgi:drug/metabolite transporter (DMT)-like permease